MAGRERYPRQRHTFCYLEVVLAMERNPYSPPAAVVADVGEIRREGRPVAVWGVLALYFLNVLGTGLRVIASFRSSIPLPAAELRFYRITGLPRATAAFLSVIFSLMLVIQLYRLKRSAAYFISASLAVSLFSVGCHVLGLEASEHAEIAYVVFGEAIELSTVGYVWYLFRTGILK
jgi:hypothetical protein